MFSINVWLRPVENSELSLKRNDLDFYSNCHNLIISSLFPSPICGIGLSFFSRIILCHINFFQILKPFMLFIRVAFHSEYSSLSPRANDYENGLYSFCHAPNQIIPDRTQKRRRNYGKYIPIFINDEEFEFKIIL